MDKGKKNIMLVYDRAENGHISTSVQHGPSSNARPDYTVSSYQIAFAMNGGYVVTVSYDGTDQKDFLTFATKEALIEALQLILK